MIILRLHIAISNGWEVKIVKKTERIHDFALLESASTPATTALGRENRGGSRIL